MAKTPHTDEGMITDTELVGRSGYRVHLDNGNAYYTSRKFNQDIWDPAFRNATVRLLLTEAHRIWDISVI